VWPKRRSTPIAKSLNNRSPPPRFPNPEGVIAVQAQRSAKERIEAQVLRLRERLTPHRASLRRAALFAALCGFAGGLFWALTAVSDIWGRIAIAPLAVLLFLGVPAMVVLNAAEFRAMAEVGFAEISWGTALEVTIYTSAANMLPFPGGVFTRLGGMRAHGIGMRPGSWLLLLFAGVWAGAAFLLSGSVIVLRSAPLGVSFLLAGAALLGFSFAGLRARGAGHALMTKILLIRLALLVVEMARMVLAVRAFGAGLSLANSAVFAISSVVGTTVSVIPAGLGIREGVSALLSPIIGLDPAVGFLAATMMRIVGMAGLAALASILLIRSGRGKPMETARKDVAPLA
jgi:hypothetical protein